MSTCGGMRAGVLPAICAVALFWMAAPPIAAGSEATTFERSVVKGDIPQATRDYYAAVWASLQFFRGTDSARSLLAGFDVVKQRRAVDSIINVLFLPLDSDPIAPGNSFLQGLTEKIDYCRNRGFLHTEEAFLTACFDDIGLLVLLNGLPEFAFLLMQEPKVCGRDRRQQIPRKRGGALSGLSEMLPDSVPTYHISWQGEDYIFQEDCFGFWRLIETELPRGGGGERTTRLVQRSFAMQKLNEQLTGGVAVFDPDEPLKENSVIASAVSILDSTDWQTSWSVINLGLRAADFVRDSSGWNRLQMYGTLSVAVSGNDQASVLDSVKLNTDMGSEKPGRDDLVALQRVERAGRADGEPGAVRGRVLGVDIVNPKGHHWKKSIPFPVGWSDSSRTIGYGWLMNPQAVNANCIGGRPPLIHDVVVQGDSLLLFFQLIKVDPDLEGRFRTHVRLRFIREEERKEEVIISKLYRLGREPWGSTEDEDLVSAATQMGLLETSSANANVTFCTRVPMVREGRYKIVAECHRTSGSDPRPFLMVIFDGVQIKKKEIQATR